MFIDAKRAFLALRQEDYVSPRCVWMLNINRAQALGASAFAP
jgi:hypothetical protein